MRIGEIRQFCQLQPEGQSLMRAAMSQLIYRRELYHRTLKLSHTIADLTGSEETLAEALHALPSFQVDAQPDMMG